MQVRVFGALDMLNLLRYWGLFFMTAVVSGCFYSDGSFHHLQSCGESDDCQAVESYADEATGDVVVPFFSSDMTADGLKYCPNHKRCTDDGILPPQPCVQPMPEHYNNVSLQEISDGVVLIHPYTRMKVICYDDNGELMEQCVENFKAQGYVLITDLPQLPAKYDFLKEGTYPTRKWRGGEAVPRW